MLVGRGAAGVIVEVEAYHQREPACHGHSGVPTARTQSLFGAPGTAYVYFTYGMHWCVNVVCEEAGVAAAALIRAVQPVHGIELMRERRMTGRRSNARPISDRELCSGPARLVQALDIRAVDDGMMLVRTERKPRAAIDARSTIAGMAECDVPCLLPPDARVLASLGVEVGVPAAATRIGISQAQDLPWRWGVAGSPFLSRRVVG